MDINALRRLKAEKLAEAKKIQDKLTDPDFNITAERRGELEAQQDKLIGEAEAINGQIEAAVNAEKSAATRADRLNRLSADSGVSRVTADKPGPVTVSEPNWTKDPMKGFESPREFFGSVAAATRSGRIEDDRLRYLAAAGSDEQSGASDPYGGFLVPSAMAPGILSVGADINPLLGLVTNIPMQAPVVELLARVDKNHSTSVSGGLTVTRRSETASLTASRMEMEKVELKATFLGGLTYATEELLRDSPQSVAALLQEGIGAEMPAKIFQEMLSGTGVGELEGILNCPATISVAKESGQAADTINGTNLLKMRQQAWRYGQAIWIANHDTYRQLVSAHTALTSNDYPLFIHGNGTDVPDTLLGRPIFFSEFAETVGDKGDIYLVNASQYLYGVYEALSTGESMHVRFENHERAFKFYTRNAGKSWWRSALTPANGANTLSPFVVLAARA